MTYICDSCGEVIKGKVVDIEFFSAFKMWAASLQVCEPCAKKFLKYVDKFIRLGARRVNE
jgi:ribosome-binding protein aMBF1 (putative translation factor)